MIGLTTTSGRRWRSSTTLSSGALQLRRHSLDSRDEGLRGEHASELIPVHHGPPGGLVDQHLRKSVKERPVRTHDRIEWTSPVGNPALAVGLLFGQLANGLALAVDDDGPIPPAIEQSARVGQ